MVTENIEEGASVEAALTVRLESMEPTAYMWQESWNDADTQYGPGDYNEELVFDTAPPIDGVVYSNLYTKEQVLELLCSNI